MRLFFQRFTSVSLTLRYYTAIAGTNTPTTAFISSPRPIFDTHPSNSSSSSQSSNEKSLTYRLYSKKGNNDNDTNNNEPAKDIMSDEVAAAKEAAATYKLSSEDKAGPETVFDNILSGKWPSDKVYEDDQALAFRDISPQAPVHILVIPKVRDGLVQLSKARDDQKALLGHLMYVAQEVGKKECPKGFRIVINDGEEGAQSVYHLHLHVLGGRQLNWPPG